LAVSNKLAAASVLAAAALLAGCGSAHKRPAPVGALPGAGAPRAIHP
jgi:hypothetical protein